MQAAGLSPTPSPFLPTAMPNAAPDTGGRQYAFAQRDTFEPSPQKAANPAPCIAVPQRGVADRIKDVVCCPVRTVYDIFQLVFSVPCVVCCAAC